MLSWRRPSRSPETGKGPRRRHPSALRANTQGGGNSARQCRVELGAAVRPARGRRTWIFLAPVLTRAPEIGAAIKQKLYVLDRPLAALRELQEVIMPSGNAVAVEPSQWGMVTPLVAFVTPAVVEVTLFFVTLIFFLATQINFRRYVASFFTTREGKLRYIRIANDIEEHLATYITTVTIINFGLGVVVALGAWLFGVPNPIPLGLRA